MLSFGQMTEFLTNKYFYLNFAIVTILSKMCSFYRRAIGDNILFKILIVKE